MTKEHVYKGAVIARILTTLQLTNEEETQLICDAIYTHSEKGLV
jgi:hypothetical protein